MRRFPRALVVPGLLAALAGCGNESLDPASISVNQAAPAAAAAPVHEQAIGGLAVIDLDALAKGLGRSQAMSDELKKERESLEGQWKIMQAEARDQIAAKKTELGETPTPEQTKELQKLSAEWELKLRQAQRYAQLLLDSQKQKLVFTFRDEVKPLAQQVAAEKGLSIVVPKNDGLVLCFQADVDITDEVLAKMQAIAPRTSPAADAVSIDSTPAPAAGIEPARLPEQVTEQLDATTVTQ